MHHRLERAVARRGPDRCATGGREHVHRDTIDDERMHGQQRHRLASQCVDRLEPVALIVRGELSLAGHRALGRHTRRRCLPLLGEEHALNARTTGGELELDPRIGLGQRTAHDHGTGTSRRGLGLPDGLLGRRRWWRRRGLDSGLDLLGRRNRRVGRRSSSSGAGRLGLGHSRRGLRRGVGLGLWAPAAGDDGEDKHRSDGHDDEGHDRSLHDWCPSKVLGITCPAADARRASR